MQRNSSLEQTPIVIIGGGPAGLACALETIKKGHSVVIIAALPYFVRGQIVVIKDKEARNILSSYIDENNLKDLKFKEKYLKNKNIAIFPIQVIEKFLARKLIEMSISDPDKVHLLIRHDGELTAIDTKKCELTLELKQVF
jgi:predicted flavoprotein YhiN